MKKIRNFYLAMYLTLQSAHTYADTTTDALNQVNNKISQLENEQKTLKSDLEKGQKQLTDSLAQMISLSQFVSYAITAWVAAITLYTLIMQITKHIQESNEKKNNNDRIKEQEKNNNELFNETRQNIHAITELLQTVRGVFSFKEELDEKLKDAETKNALYDARYAEQLAAHNKDIERVNRTAIEICSNIKRNNYRTPDNRQKYQEFSSGPVNKLNEDELNANAFLILGLNSAIGYSFGSATENLKKAIKKSEICEDSSFDANDPSFKLLYPEKPAQDLKKWLQKLANISLYYYAITEYNLGNYKDAEESFRKAIMFDKTDVKSMTYIPEALFLAERKQFSDVVAEYERTISAIERIQASDNWAESKESILSQLYIRYGNCYYPEPDYEQLYKDYKDLKKAEGFYQKAIEYSKDFYITKFSYAQVLKQKADKVTSLSAAERQAAAEQADKLFKQIFEALKIKVGQTDEAKILVMLYYIMAICCKESKIPNADTQRYISEIYEAARYLPRYDKANKENIRIFSPLTKRDLVYPYLLEEIEKFGLTS